MDEISVKPAVPEDFERLCELSLAMFREHHQLDPTFFAPLRDPLIDHGRFTAGIADSECRYLVAWSAGVALGFILARVSRSSNVPVFVPCDFVNVDELFVVLQARNRGVAQRLFDATKCWAVDKRITTIRLGVYTCCTAAVAFWKKQEFAPYKNLLELGIINLE